MRGFYEDVAEDTISDYAHVIEYGIDGDSSRIKKEAVMIYVNAIVLDVDWDEPQDASELVLDIEKALFEKTGMDLDAPQLRKRLMDAEDD
jgi:hypothetical protein